MKLKQRFHWLVRASKVSMRILLYRK